MKKIFTLFVLMAFALMQLTAQEIILVTDDDNDDEQVTFLENQGFNVTKFYPDDNLSTVGQDTIDLLNAADLIIIGRSPGSSDFRDSADRVTWNALTPPLILNAQYIARSSRLNWFNSTAAYHANEWPPLAHGVISDPADTIFTNVTLMAGDSMGWCYAAHDFIDLDSATNGTILAAYADTNPLVVRFAANVEFYDGSVDMPAGPRTYFGFGNDKLGVNYFPLTKDARAVYLAEINRMLGQEVQEPVYGSGDNRIILVTDDENDDLQYEFLQRQGFNVSKFYPDDNLSTVGQDTIDMLNAADLLIIGRSPSSSDFRDSADRVIWNALTPPLLMNAQYIARSSRLNWFNSTAAYHANEWPPIAHGVVSDPADLIFDDVTLMVGDSMEWCYAAHDFIDLDSATNGTILAAYADTNPLIARFAANVEFYDGSVDMPAGPRTYFGFGNDKLGINYFPLTRDAKTVYLAEICRMVGIDAPEIKFGAADYSITFITDDEYDDPQIKFLEKNGIRVTKFYPDDNLSTVGQDTIDMLNDAELLIIGRSPSSSDFRDSADRVTWNALTPPLILDAQYVARSSRLNWFNSTNAYHANEEPLLAYGVSSDPGDIVFSNVTLTGDSLGWCWPPHDFINVDSATNGTILVAYADTNPLVARFDANVEFYDGSVDMPAGPRAYFGFGNDKLVGYNYFPLTDDAQQVYLNEISRMLGAEMSIAKTISQDMTLSDIQYSVATATLDPAFHTDSTMYSLTLVQDSNVVTITAVPSNEMTTTVGDSTIDVSMGDTITTKIVVTAENGNAMEYEVTVFPFIATGTKEIIEVSRLHMYPNPASDVLNLVSDGEFNRVRVYNTLGKVVIDRTLNGPSQIQLDIHSLDPGLYIIKAENGGDAAIGKFLKK